MIAMVGFVGTSSTLAQLSIISTQANYTTISHQQKLPLNSAVSGNRSLKLKSVVLKALSTSTTENVETQAPKIEDEVESKAKEEKFDWYAQWYPIMPVCDMDKRVPHGKTVMGIDVVVWWDKNESQWRVFEDMCPHRLAPLSDGRIDQWGRLQCVYHGWCFSGSGNCKLIPQAPPDGPQVHTFNRACVTVYPSTVQNGMVWFWPNSDPKFKDILEYQKPPFMPEIDDPSYVATFGNRDIPYGYEVLIENLMDPSHVAYAHYGIMRTIPPKTREGGRPYEMSVEKLDINGYVATQEWGISQFIAPCIFYAYPKPPEQSNTNGSASSSETNKKKRSVLIFIGVPVSPGKSRLIWAFPRNFAVWMDRAIPKWIFHINQNLILDSDLYLVHVQERKIMEAGPSKWQKATFVPTKADALVVGYRRWLNKYSQGMVDWGDKFNAAALPPTPPREQLFDRYWTHVVNCPSCNSAYKTLSLTETALQIISVGLVGFLGLTKQATMTTTQRSTLFAMAILCFAASKWLSHFVYKTFRYHDYNHAFK